MAYETALDRYLAPARAKPQLWRLALGVPLVLAVWLIGSTAIVAPVTMLLIRHGAAPEAAQGWLLSSPGGVLTVLASFTGAILGAWAAARWLHGRRFGTLMGKGAHVVRDFIVAAGVVLGLALPLTLAALPFSEVAPGLALSHWVLYLTPMLLGLALQTLGEELMFRGYLLQQLAARFRSPLIWMVLPSLAFAALHFFNAPGAGFSAGTMAAMMAILFLFGLAAADLTAATGSIGAAWGFHFANNFIAIGVIAPGETLNGLALWQSLPGAGGGPGAVELALNALMVAAAWILCRRLLRR